MQASQYTCETEVLYLVVLIYCHSPPFLWDRIGIYFSNILYISLKVCSTENFKAQNIRYQHINGRRSGGRGTLENLHTTSRGDQKEHLMETKHRRHQYLTSTIQGSELPKSLCKEGSRASEPLTNRNQQTCRECSYSQS